MTTDAAASSWRSLARLLGALLRTLESLAFIARSLHPPRFAEVLAAVGRPDDDLRAELEGLAAWGADLDWARAPSTRAANEALAAFDALREADDLRAVFRALR